MYVSLYGVVRRSRQGPRWRCAIGGSVSQNPTDVNRKPHRRTSHMVFRAGFLGSGLKIVSQSWLTFSFFYRYSHSPTWRSARWGWSQ